jgi:hypothetical protein
MGLLALQIQANSPAMPHGAHDKILTLYVIVQKAVVTNFPIWSAVADRRADTAFARKRPKRNRRNR